MSSLTAFKPAPLLPSTSTSPATADVSGVGNTTTSPKRDTSIAGQYTTTTPPRRVIPSHLPNSLSNRNVFTPYNTPAEAPPLAIQRKGSVSASPAANPGSGGGRPIGGNSILSRVPHAITPGNTPSSLEKIGRRMASNLMITALPSGNGGGRIAPSYERRFNAGLPDINERLAAQADATPCFPQSFVTPSPSLRTKHAFIGGQSAKQADWPTSFSDGTASMSSEKTVRVKKADEKEEESQQNK